MATYEEKIAALQKNLCDIEKQERDLQYRAEKIKEEIEAVEKLRVENSDKLSESEEKDLRKQLTQLGKLLCGPHNVCFANLDIVNEAPDMDSARGYAYVKIIGKYSFSIKCDLIEEYGGPGFKINAQIKTLLPHVESIVRDMFDEEGMCETKIGPITNWSTDWDYGNRIVLKKPYKEETSSDSE